LDIKHSYITKTITIHVRVDVPVMKGSKSFFKL